MKKETSWEMQVKIEQVEDGKLIKKFVSVRCSGMEGYTYRYATKLEAEKSLISCYGYSVMNEDLRVIEVDAPANIRHN